jgi:ankyrin repeat protein
MKHLLLTTIAAVLLVGCGQSMSIHDAAKSGDIESIKQYLDSGSEIELICQTCGLTILGHVSWGGHREIIELLIAEGVDVNVKDKTGAGPLLPAVLGGRKDIVEILIDEGADVNTKNNKNVRPLHLAARDAQNEIAEMLINKGADINSKNIHGLTPLYYACARGHNEIVELLINKDANLNVRVSLGEYKGYTPLDSAIKWNHPETADLLRKHGGKTGEELKAEGK